jgi:hypothetical protein
MALGGLAQATLGRARSPAPVQTAAKISIERTRGLARLLLRAVIDRSRLDEDLRGCELSIGRASHTTSAVWRRWTRIIALWKSLVWSARSATYRSGRPPLPQRCARLRAAALLCVRGPSRCARRPAGLPKPPQAASRTRPEGRRPNLPNSFFDSPKRHWNNKNSERASCYRTLPCAVSRLGSGIRRPWGRACVTRYGKPDEAADVRGFEAAGTLGRRRHQESARKWREPRRPPPNARQPNAAI